MTIPPMILTSGGRMILSGGRVLSGAAGETVTEPTTAITLDDVKSAHLLADPVAQRRAGSWNDSDAGCRDIPVLFTFAGGAPANPQARVVAADGGAVIKDWTTLTGVTVAGSSALGYLDDVPAGQDYNLQVRDGNNTSLFSNGSRRWGVGVVFAFFGQSNQVGTLVGDFGEIVPGKEQNEYGYYNAGLVGGAIFDNAGWHSPSNGSNGPSGSFNSGNTATGNIIKFLRIVEDRLKAKYGRPIPVGIIPWAFGSQTIESFTAPAGTHYANLFAGSGVSGTTIGLASPRNIYAGDFEGAFWHQGEANQTDSATTYLTKLTALRQGLLNYVAPFGRDSSTMFFGAAVVGNYAPSACPSIENIRTAVLNSGWTSWTTIDLTRTDTLHFGGKPEQKRSMMRCIQSALKWLGCATFSGRGPRITTTAVTHSGGTAVLSVAHETGSPATALVTATGAAAVTGFYGSNDNFATEPFAIPATLSGNQIILDVAGRTLPLHVKYLGGRIGSTAVDGNGYTASCNPNISNAVYDNVSYPTGVTGTDVEARGLPLLPTPDSIEVT